MLSAWSGDVTGRSLLVVTAGFGLISWYLLGPSAETKNQAIMKAVIGLLLMLVTVSLGEPQKKRLVWQSKVQGRFIFK